MSLDLLTAPIQAKSPKTRPIRKKALTQIIELQDTAYSIAQDPDVKETVRCFAMRSFCMLQEERRKLSMQPLPKPIDVTKKPRRSSGKPTSPAYQEPEPGPEQAKAPPGTTTGGVQPGQGKA